MRCWLKFLRENVGQNIFLRFLLKNIKQLSSFYLNKIRIFESIRYLITKTISHKKKCKNHLNEIHEYHFNLALIFFRERVYLAPVEDKEKIYVREITSSIFRFLHFFMCGTMKLFFFLLNWLLSALSLAHTLRCNIGSCFLVWFIDAMPVTKIGENRHEFYEYYSSQYFSFVYSYQLCVHTTISSSMWFCYFTKGLPLSYFFWIIYLSLHIIYSRFSVYVN